MLVPRHLAGIGVFIECVRRLSAASRRVPFALSRAERPTSAPGRPCSTWPARGTVSRTRPNATDRTDTQLRNSPAPSGTAAAGCATTATGCSRTKTRAERARFRPASGFRCQPAGRSWSIQPPPRSGRNLLTPCQQIDNIDKTRAPRGRGFEVGSGRYIPRGMSYLYEIYARRQGAECHSRSPTVSVLEPDRSVLPRRKPDARPF